MSTPRVVVTDRIAMTRHARVATSSPRRRRVATTTHADATRNGRTVIHASTRASLRARSSAKAPVGSALDAAQAYSNFVLDSKKFVEEAEARAGLDLGPRAGVVSSSVLLYSVKSGGRDAGAVEGAMASAAVDGVHAGNYERVVDKAKANLADMWATRVDGRVSVELGWWLANDVDECVKKASELRALCDELRTPRDKLLFKVPATYAGVEATRRLEALGIPVHVSHVYCREQADAAIDAGATVVQLYYSRVNAWHKAKGTLTPGDDPAYALARDALARVRSTGAKTKIMVASLASVDAVKRVLGVDYCLVSQRIIDELAETPAGDFVDAVVADARASPPPPYVRLSETEFKDACAKSPAKEEIEIALQRNAARDRDLIDYISEAKAGGGNA